MTTPGKTEDLPVDDEGAAAGAALAAGLEAVARLYQDALDTLSSLAHSWDQPDTGGRVLRMAALPAVSQRGEAAAA